MRYQWGIKGKQAMKKVPMLFSELGMDKLR